MADTKIRTSSELKSERISVVIPGAMVAQMEEVSRADSRSTSEIVRDALRLYLRARVPQRVGHRAERRKYSGVELAHVAEMLESDPSYAAIREEASLWEGSTTKDGLEHDDA
jgi:Arc/MetJ-type ribon-helix-helix transcriptional regulator